jgi:hypothetical protein
MVNTRNKVQYMLALLLLALTSAAQGRNTLPKIDVRAIEVLDVARPDIGVGEPFSATIRVTVTHDAEEGRLATFTIFEMAMLENNVCSAAIQQVTLDGEVYQHQFKTS